MADKKQTLWFENTLTGSVQNIKPGTPEHKRLITEVIEDADGVPHRVWKELDKAPTVKSVKYESGIQATVHNTAAARRSLEQSSADGADDKADD